VHERVLVTGAGPIGLLAALMSVQRGFETHVLDRAQTGIKPDLVDALGASYHTGSIDELCEQAEPDVIVECTGVARLVVDAMRFTAPGAVVCLTGVAPSRSLSVDVGEINNEIVLENDVVFGSVNANRRHFEQAAAALKAADRDWLARLVTRRVSLERWREALDKDDDDIKVVVEFAA
jgi:threonine dehydrogenase-like Zn-dependent dehydrogenase